MEAGTERATGESMRNIGMMYIIIIRVLLVRGFENEINRLSLSLSFSAGPWLARRRKKESRKLLGSWIAARLSGRTRYVRSSFATTNRFYLSVG